MRASEFISEELETEAQMVWGRKNSNARGGNVGLKFKCTSGPRKSRQVSHPSKCYDHPDVAKAQRMKTTRKRTGPTQSRHQKRTKSINTASAMVRKLNNPGKRPGSTKPWY
jgi:hypothetical protein